eukprot:5000206-Prymnesium_polylepis.1
MALGALMAASGCGAEGSWVLASRVRLAHLMGITLMLSVHALAFGMHCTRRGDSSIGLQCCEQLGAGFSCEAGALD